MSKSREDADLIVDHALRERYGMDAMTSGSRIPGQLGRGDLIGYGRAARAIASDKGLPAERRAAMLGAADAAGMALDAIEATRNRPAPARPLGLVPLSEREQE